EVVADLAVLARVDARQRELLADPRAVRVDDLAEQQLGTDGEDVTPHGRPSARPSRTAESRAPTAATTSPRPRARRRGTSPTRTWAGTARHPRRRTAARPSTSRADGREGRSRGA